MFSLEILHPSTSAAGTSLFSTRTALGCWAALVGLRRTFPVAEFNLTRFDRNASPSITAISEEELMRAALAEPTALAFDLGTAPRVAA